MLDFFERQEQARHRGRWLVTLFFLTVFAIAGVLCWVGTLFHPWAGVAVAGMVAGPILWTSWWRSAVLQRVSGAAIAEGLGARQLPVRPTDRRQRELRHVAEEMAIAAGVPVPALFVLDRETAINAFAVGHEAGDAAIAVTQGALQRLTREELQGVVAHEFSHILGGDMALNLRLMGWMAGLVVVAEAGDRLWAEIETHGDEDGRHVAGMMLLMPLAALLQAAGGFGVVVAEALKSAASREQERLADAAAVQFTRYPAGLAGALKKALALERWGHLRMGQRRAVSHMLFASPGRPIDWVLATHPPLVDRIVALDPDWDGTLPDVERASSQATVAWGDAGASLCPDRGQAIEDRMQERLVHLGIVSAPAALTMIAQAGRAEAGPLAAARIVAAQSPEPLREAAGDAGSAQALIFALLAGRPGTDRGPTLKALAATQPNDVVRRTEHLVTATETLTALERFALIDLAVPALREAGPEQLKRFHHTAHDMIVADGAFHVFEFAVSRALQRWVPVHGERAPARRSAPDAETVRQACGVLLSAVAWAGHPDDAAQAQEAFARGAGRWEAGHAPDQVLAPDACWLDELDAALDRLGGLPEAAKRSVLQACAETAAHDGLLTETEIEAIRAIGDALGCPFPLRLPD